MFLGRIRSHVSVLVCYENCKSSIAEYLAYRSLLLASLSYFFCNNLGLQRIIVNQEYASLEKMWRFISM